MGEPIQPTQSGASQGATLLVAVVDRICVHLLAGKVVKCIHSCGRNPERESGLKNLRKVCRSQKV